MESQEPFELWLPGADGESVDAASRRALNVAILEAARSSRAEVTRLVTTLVTMGQHHQAGRCLEIVAQHRLGIEVSGEELLSYRDASFGGFHDVIYDLLRAGALYHLAGRQRTSRAAIRRALLFVEEGIRSIETLNRVDHGELVCLGLAFELAGHCCVALEDADGHDYYRAARRYWSQSARLRPEALFQWTHHPVTQTVIRCLGPVVEIRPADDCAHDDLFAADYATRIDTATRLLA